MNLLKRGISESRNELVRHHRTRSVCSAHLEAVCTESLFKYCRQKVENNCFDRFSVADDDGPLELDIHPTHISFDLIEDQKKRERFQSIPITLQLPK